MCPCNMQVITFWLITVYLDKCLLKMLMSLFVHFISHFQSFLLYVLKNERISLERQA